MALFLVTKSSDYTYEEKIEINSIEELLEFQEKNYYPIIISKSMDKKENIIEIYDYKE